MKILHFHELMGMVFPPIDLDEEFAQGKFAENVSEDGKTHTTVFTAVYRPYAPTRKLLHIMTPSSAAMTQATFKDAVKAPPAVRTAMRYFVCPVATLTLETLKKLVKECNPSHLMVDVDVLDKEHKKFFYNRSGSRTLFSNGECIPIKTPPAFMNDEAEVA